MFHDGDRKSLESLECELGWEHHFEDAEIMRSVLPTDTSAMTSPACVKV